MLTLIFVFAKALGSFWEGFGRILGRLSGGFWEVFSEVFSNAISASIFDQCFEVRNLKNNNFP